MVAKTNVSATYKKTTLKNGIRVVTESLPASRSTAIGVWVNVGSRHESPLENGLSHFTEHIVFKGTDTRNPAQIASSLESLGGSLNAFTSREQTCFTARILDEYLTEAMDVLADLVCRAKLAPAAIKKERQVICEEIKESLDTPSDHIHDLFAKAFWGEHPLGQAIMGPQKNVSGFTAGSIKKFMARHYNAGSVLVSASGSISHQKLVRLVREKLDLSRGHPVLPKTAERTTKAAQSVTRNDSSQTHLCIGFSGLPYSDENRYAALVLSTYLGGGMSSVLFQKIREQHGLAYTVYAFHEMYRDAGIFGIYLGTDSSHLQKAYEIVLKECDKLRRNKIPSDLLEQTKSQIKGHLIIGLESTSARMNWLARQELLSGEYCTPDVVLKRIEAVTPSAVMETANRILDRSQLTVASLGPAPDNFPEI